MEILLVDDDKYLTKTMEYFLSEVGMSVDVKNRFSTDLLKEGFISNYDVVVLDLMMRRPSDFKVEKGLETGEMVYKYIRRMEPKPKVVIVTAIDSPKLQKIFDRDGVLVLKKPLSPDFSDLISGIYDA